MYSEEAADNRPTEKRLIKWRQPKEKHRKRRKAHIVVYGSWNKFETPVLLEYRGNGLFECEVEVPKGEEHYYRFLIDDEWEVDRRVSTTFRDGNAYNTLVPPDEEQKLHTENDADAGMAYLMYDQQTGLPMVRRHTQRKRSKHRHSGRHSVEVAIPKNLLKEQGEPYGEPTPVEMTDKERRRRKRKRKRKKNRESSKSRSTKTGSASEELLKRKEEEWSRICFVQNLRQQQAHSKELENVKKLWKQERQVRTDMHKKLADRNKSLEDKLLNLEASRKKLESNAEHDKVADEKKMVAMKEDTQRLRTQLAAADEAKKLIESQFNEFKKEKALELSSNQDALSESRKQLQEAKLDMSTQSTEVQTLSMKLKNIERMMKAAGDKHKMAIEAERERVVILQVAADEDQDVIAKLRGERNKLEASLRKHTRELQSKSDGRRELENELEELRTTEEALRRKIKQLQNDTTASKRAEKQLKEVEEQYQKEIKHLKEDSQRLQDKVQAADARNIDLKQEHEDQIEKLREEADMNMKALSKEGMASEEQLQRISENMKNQSIELSDKNEEIRTLAEKIKELEIQITRKSKALDEADEELSANKKEKNSISDMLSDAKQELASTLDRCQSLEESLDHTKKLHTARYEELVKELAEWKDSSQNKDDIIKSLRVDMESLQEKVKNLKNNLQDTMQDKNKLAEDVTSARAEVEKMVSNEQTLETKLKNMHESLENLQKESHSEIAELNKKLSSASKDLATIEEKHRAIMDELQTQKDEVEERLAQTEKEYAVIELQLKKITSDYEIEKSMWEQEKASLQAKVDAANSKDEKIIACCKAMFRKFQDVRIHLGVIRTLKIDEVDQMNTWVPNFQEMLDKALGFNAKLVSDTMEKYKKELSLRRKYFNLVQELRGNIRVFCRVRPLLEWEKKKGMGTCIKFPPTEDFMIEVPSKDAIGGKFIFEYDRVYKPDAQQRDITEDTSEYVQSVMDGYNVSIFAYGQTGSGKTWTMDGPKEDPGVNLHALQELFKVVSERVPMFEYTITMSVYEIYNNAINCLLSDAKEKKRRGGKKTEYKARATPNGVVVENGMEIEVKCRDDVLKLMEIAKSNRKTACTNMNDTSSRSHMIVIVSVQGYNVPANIEYLGKLFMVDLAGSERVAKSGVTGKRFTEALEINKSLTALGDVMQALQKKTSYIPYRNSTLTYLMQNALGGHAKTIMFINICPTDEHVLETLSSLRFAQRVAKVELGKAQKTFKKVDRLNQRALQSNRNLRSGSHSQSSRSLRSGSKM